MRPQKETTQKNLRFPETQNNSERSKMGQKDAYGGVNFLATFSLEGKLGVSHAADRDVHVLHHHKRKVNLKPEAVRQWWNRPDAESPVPSIQ